MRLIQIACLNRLLDTVVILGKGGIIGAGIALRHLLDEGFVSVVVRLESGELLRVLLAGETGLRQLRVEIVELLLVVALEVLPRRLLDTLFIALELAAADHHDLQGYGGRERHPSPDEFGFAQFVSAFVDPGEGVGFAVLQSGHEDGKASVLIGHDGVILSLYAHHGARHHL